MPDQTTDEKIATIVSSIQAINEDLDELDKGMTGVNKKFLIGAGAIVGVAAIAILQGRIVLKLVPVVNGMASAMQQMLQPTAVAMPGVPVSEGYASNNTPQSVVKYAPTIDETRITNPAPVDGGYDPAPTEAPQWVKETIAETVEDIKGPAL